MKYEVGFEDNNGEYTRVLFDQLKEAEKYAKNITMQNIKYAHVISQNCVRVADFKKGKCTHRYKHKNCARGIIERKKR